MTDSNAKGAIACIGWGSLVWSPRTLPQRGTWRDDGPLLPVEFARESGGKGKESNLISLVIHPAAPRVQTLWTLLDVPDLNSATLALGKREYDRADSTWIEKYIGVWDSTTGQAKGMESDTIGAWAMTLWLAGVVWTNLPCGFRDSSGNLPDVDAVLAFLTDLSGAHRSGAEEYVRKAPPQIDTPYRRRIAEVLGWTYQT